MNTKAYARALLCVLLFWVIGYPGSGSNLLAQSPPVATTDKEQTEQRDEAEQVTRWIEQLGDDEFAVRERAASNLVTLGLEVLPQLRQAADSTSDPEIRLRTTELIRHLTDGEQQARVGAFLAGEDVPFEGWGPMRALMGSDSISVRELFVEIMLAHPDLTASLDGSSRDRFLAMEATMGRVQHKMFNQLQVPVRADVVALLLPAVDPNVPMNQAFEGLMLSVLQKEAASKLHIDIQLSAPVHQLVSEWMNRTSVTNRAEILFFAMRWDLAKTLPLAQQTLAEATSAESLVIAMQLIARFGDRSDAKQITALLNDTRVVNERGFAEDERVQTQVGDVAMAAIAILHGQSLSQIGFENAEKHPTFSFLPVELGFPVADPTVRQQTRQRIDLILSDSNQQPES